MVRFHRRSVGVKVCAVLSLERVAQASHALYEAGVPLGDGEAALVELQGVGPIGAFSRTPRPSLRLLQPGALGTPLLYGNGIENRARLMRLLAHVAVPPTGARPGGHARRAVARPG